MPLDALLKSDQAKTTLNGFLGGAAGGALVSAFTNKKSAKKMLKAGGLVALGGVAWSAYKNYQEKSQTADVASSPQGLTAPAPIDAAAETCLSNTILFRAMAAAAHADGHIDDNERNRIWQQALEAGLEGEALNNFEALLNQPPSLEEIRREATNMESRLEIYTASRLVIDATSPQGQQYIKMLKSTLSLPSALTDAVDSRVAI